MLEKSEAPKGARWRRALTKLRSTVSLGTTPQTLSPNAADCAKAQADAKAAAESVQLVMQVCNVEEAAAVQLLQVPHMHDQACTHAHAWRRW